MGSCNARLWLLSVVTRLIPIVQAVLGCAILRGRGMRALLAACSLIQIAHETARNRPSLRSKADTHPAVRFPNYTCILD